MGTLTNKPTDRPLPLLTQLATPKKPIGPDQLCPSAKEHAAQLAINLIDGKWKIEILCGLQQGPIRLGQLRRSIPVASRKMLTEQLRRMEKDGLIVRTDLSSRLRHVEYSLSERHGVALLQLINVLAAWGTEYQSRDNASTLDANEVPSSSDH
jgi:DNA-binding HxlR family transcriptional regulator